MRRVVLANCFPPACPGAQALITDEVLVAAAAAPELVVTRAEEHIDEALAHSTSVEMARAAFEWFRVGAEDPSLAAEGISAGDLGGAEAAVSILMPAARAVLSMTAALEEGLEPSTLISVVPAGAGRYERLETLAAEAAIATARARIGPSLTVERAVSDDTRNGWLRGKYSSARDPDYLVQGGTRRRAARAVALGLSNLRARRHRERPALLVLEYRPSHEFARTYGARRHRRWRLVCWPATPRDLLAIARAGDEAILPLVVDVARQPSSGAGQRLRDRAGELDGAALRVAGVELWPIVGEPLIELAERYGRYAEGLAPVIRRELASRAVDAVLVPFDGPAHARLLVRVAQSMGIPTFVINDGFKADEIQQEGMTADVALAWSQAMCDCYFSRRANGAIVTGNPRAERLSRRARQRRGAQRVLVGGHTFSPIDLNCRRSDSERFLEEALDGIAAARAQVATKILVKLHPADPLHHYRSAVEAHPQLQVELRNTGDVVDLFHDFDVYITTYSTSLLEAAAVGMPIIYYQINGQIMGSPFSGDDFIACRTASTPSELATLLGERDLLETPPPDGWVERHLGPATGALDRILTAIDTHVPARHIAAGSRAGSTTALSKSETSSVR